MLVKLYLSLFLSSKLIVFRQESKSKFESVVSEPSTSTSSLIYKRVSEKSVCCCVNGIFVGCSIFLWMSDSAGILFGLRPQYLSSLILICLILFFFLCFSNRSMMSQRKHNSLSLARPLPEIEVETRGQINLWGHLALNLSSF